MKSNSADVATDFLSNSRGSKGRETKKRQNHSFIRVTCLIYTPLHFDTDWNPQVKRKWRMTERGTVYLYSRQFDTKRVNYKYFSFILFYQRGRCHPLCDSDWNPKVLSEKTNWGIIDKKGYIYIYALHLVTLPIPHSCVLKFRHKKGVHSVNFSPGTLRSGNKERKNTPCNIFRVRVSCTSKCMYRMEL